MTLAELISKRRAKIEAFERDINGHVEHNIFGVNDAMERTPSFAGTKQTNSMMRC